MRNSDKALLGLVLHKGVRTRNRGPSYSPERGRGLVP